MAAPFSVTLELRIFGNYIEVMPNSIDCRFDAHCHLFNIKYLELELAHILKDAIAGDYEHRNASDDPTFPHDPISSIHSVMGWLEELKKGLLESDEEHWLTLQTAAQKAWADGLPVKAIPLMMDVYYLFAKSLGPNERANVHERQSNLWQKVLSFIFGSNGAYHSAGFDFERKNMTQLVHKYPGTLFPFFAVDPRRPGVIDEVLRGKTVSKNGPFYGIKLYPRLGYHPQCADLWRIYAWCEINHIPIITHTDEIGFPPPPLEQLLHINEGELGNPANYADILAKHPNLVIDFAHFGMSNATWAEQIAIFMEKFPAVYSDLACYTSAEAVRNFKRKFWSRPMVAQRTMFGTDFDVMLAVAPGSTLDNYYRDFSEIHNPGAFSAEELAAMSCTIPKAFLR